MNMESPQKPATKDSIIALPDPRLHQKSVRIGVVSQATIQLAQDMIAATLDWEQSRDHEFGAALAAVQMGELFRVVVVRNDFEDKDEKSFGVFINPEIVKREGVPEEGMEGCLSVPDIYGKVARYPKIKIKALNLDGQMVRLTATGFLARVFQHEIDHTEGTLFIDHVDDPDKLYNLEGDGSFSKYNGPAISKASGVTNQSSDTETPPRALQ